MYDNTTKSEHETKRILFEKMNQWWSIPWILSDAEKRKISNTTIKQLIIGFLRRK